ncbi:MAG: hypothetical protein ACR2PB_14990, partial [Desulfocapsaceae bacterium]
RAGTVLATRMKQRIAGINVDNRTTGVFPYLVENVCFFGQTAQSSGTSAARFKLAVDVRRVEN